MQPATLSQIVSDRVLNAMKYPAYDEYNSIVYTAPVTPPKLELLIVEPDKNRLPEGSKVNPSRLDDILSEIPDIEVPTTNVGKRWIQNKRVFFTYKTHIDKSDIYAHFKQNWPSIDFIRAAHETGDDACPYLHTHLLVDFGKIVQAKDCRAFDYMGIHPNIKAVKTALHWNRLKNYLSKEDVSNEDLYDLLDPVTVIQSYSSKREAMAALMKKKSDLRYATSISMIYDDKPPEMSKFHEEEDLFQWQAQFHDILIKPPQPAVKKPSVRSVVDAPFEFPSRRDGRSIYVIYDPIGGTGKTHFIKYMTSLDPKRFFFTQGLGQSRDIAEVVKNAQRNGWTGETMLVNLTRQLADHKIYETLESLIDGMFTSQKYSGSSMRYEARTVVLFSNFMPNLRKVSVDRWIILGIDRITKNLVSIPTDEGIRIYIAESEQRAFSENYMARVGVDDRYPPYTARPTYAGLAPITR